MQLGDRPVRAVMTPRREVDMLDLADDARRPFAAADRREHRIRGSRSMWADARRGARGRAGQGLCCDAYLREPETARHARTHIRPAPTDSGFRRRARRGGTCSRASPVHIGARALTSTATSTGVVTVGRHSRSRSSANSAPKKARRKRRSCVAMMGLC